MLLKFIRSRTERNVNVGMAVSKLYELRFICNSEKEKLKGEFKMSEVEAEVASASAEFQKTAQLAKKGKGSKCSKTS